MILEILQWLVQAPMKKNYLKLAISQSEDKESNNSQ